MIRNDRIKQLRLLHDLTLKDVAARLGISEATAQRYESSAIKTIPYEAIEKYSQIFGCSPAFIMGWESASPMALSDSEQDLIRAFRSAPEGIKEAVRKLLDIKSGGEINE